MKILLVGATGKTGQQILAQALEAGYAVTALVRSPEKITQPQDRLAVMVGEALDEAAVEQAVQSDHFEAVIVAMGSSSLKNTGIRATSTTYVVKALQKHLPEAHLWVVSSAGTGSSLQQVGLLSKIFVKTVIAGPVQDHEAQEAAVRSSSLVYTIVRPVGLSDGPASGGAYVVKAEGKLLQRRIARADVAHFIINNLERSAYQRKAVALSAS